MQLTQIINSQAVPLSSVPRIINRAPPLPYSKNYLGIAGVIKDNYSYTFALNIACPLKIYFALFYGVSDRFAVSE